MTAPLVILTNGDSAARLLAEAAPAVAILPWRDMLHDGPVPGGLPLPELSALRARWLAAELDLDPAEVATTFAERDRRLAAIEPGTEIALCFEHDLYDQLQVLQILGELAPRAGELRVTLAQGDDYLGSQSPAWLAQLLARRQPVDAATFAVASRVWAAFRSPTPEALARERDTAIPALPWLMPALARLLQELPDAAGLTRTERTALTLLEAAPDTPAGLFGRVSELEEARFLGDWPFFRRLAGLASPPDPLLVGLPGRFRPSAPVTERMAWTRSRLTLTAAGRAVLASEHDRLTGRPPDRWLGGTHLRPGHVWRWDAAAGRLTRDPA